MERRAEGRLQAEQQNKIAAAEKGQQREDEAASQQQEDQGSRHTTIHPSPSQIQTPNRLPTCRRCGGRLARRNALVDGGYICLAVLVPLADVVLPREVQLVLGLAAL